jgi:hypothetical protein
MMAKTLSTVFVVLALTQISTAQITTAVSGDTLTIGVGTRDGVRVGMTGRITKQEMVGGQLQTFEIARFEVTGVSSSSCTAQLTDVGAGWQVEPGMEVSFDQKLVPPEPTAKPTPRPPTPTPTPKPPSDPVELLKQGNAAWDRQDWARAAELYGKLVQLAPDNPIAQSRAAEAHRKSEAAELQRTTEQRRLEEELREQQAEEARRQQELAQVPLWRETAKMLLESGDRALAAEYLAKISHVAPEDPYIQTVISNEVREAETLLEAKKYHEVLEKARWLAIAGAEAEAARLREDPKVGPPRAYCRETVRLAELPIVPTNRRPNILVLWGDSVAFPEEGPPPSIRNLMTTGLTLCVHQGGANSVAGRGAFVTGLLPENSGLEENPEAAGMRTAMDGLPFATIAALLKKQGYATGHFGPSRLGDRDQALPSAHGFEEFYGNLYEMSFEMGPEEPGYPTDREYRARYGPRGVIRSSADGRIEDTGPLTKRRMQTFEQETARMAINFIERSVASDKPFFVWWNSIRLGDKVIVGDIPDGGSEKDAAILDQHLRIEAILDSINKLGISGSTIVVYSVDDVPGEGEVPAVISWPGVLESNSSWDGQTSHEDWLPTLLTAAGRPNIVEELLAGLTLAGKTFQVKLDGTSLFRAGSSSITRWKN